MNRAATDIEGAMIPGYTIDTLVEKGSVRTRASLRKPGGANAETVAAPASSRAPSGFEPVPAFANGSMIAGKYLVEETIAEGGIGIVVVARHLALEQRVAIKYLKPRTLANPVIVERFVREARLAAQLASEHVVRVYDVGALPDAGPYMVMEYLVGEDLGQTIESGPLSIARAVDYVLQACDALAEAHALQIVHRDVKPDNMFLSQRTSGTPILKIIDFGISKIAPKRGERERWATETASSERFGTPLYMSPEQLRSTSSVDARTDIWSLGVVLHELMTGSLPFAGSNLPQVCTSVLTSPPARLMDLRPAAPRQLQAAILKCLEKDPKRRFRNVAELAQELGPFGPSSAPDRVERIVDIIRRAGGSIRPPSRPLDPRVSQSAPSMGPPVESTVGRALTSDGLRVPPGMKKRIAMGLSAAVVCAFTLFGAAHFATPRVRAHGAAFASLAGPHGSSAAAADRPQPPAATVSPTSSVALPLGPADLATAPIAPVSPTDSLEPSTSLDPAAQKRSNAAAKAYRSNALRSPATPAKLPASGADARRAQFGERE
ncbi:MAG: protein kinase [Polyangiaceae bacterium]|jgi:serine/threonine-protein kinase